MKKLTCLVIVFLLVLSMVPCVFAAPSASMSGPSTVRAGDTITVSFSAGGGIYGCSGAVSYDSSLLTLNGLDKMSRVGKKNICKLLLNTYLAGLTVLKKGR